MYKATDRAVSIYHQILVAEIYFAAPEISGLIDLFAKDFSSDVATGEALTQVRVLCHHAFFGVKLFLAF